MSTLGMSTNNNGGSSFKEFKKQASFFLKEKIKTARLALTDVTPAELLTEEATNGNPWAPDTRTLKMISKAAFEVDDYRRIINILHNRLARFDRNNWRVSYHALIVVEHLLTHGPESVADEFQTDKEVIREMGNFQYIDEKGFNWGINIRRKSEKLINLMDKGPLLKEERDRARKVSRGIQGFGSFSQRTSSAQGVLQESSFARRSDSQFIENGDHENQFSSSNDKDFDQIRLAGLQENTPDENVKLMLNDNSFVDNQKITDVGTQTSYFEENVAPASEHITEDTDRWDSTGDSKPLLGNNEYDSRLNVSVEDHPFDDDAQETTVSLLSTTYTRAQAC